MRYCRYCGKQVPDDAQFCPACGKPLASFSRKPSGGTPAPASEPLFRVNDRQDNHEDSSQDPSKEDGQKKSLWGCTIFFILFAGACAVGVFIYNSFFTGRENPLIPQDEDSIAVVDEQETAQPVSEDLQGDDQPMDGESLLQLRVQKIYDDVLFNSNRNGCVQQYCTDALKVLISKAEATGEYWIDYDFWTYSNDCDRPAIESVKVETYSGYMADVKVAVRPYADGQAVNVIVLKMERENGQWLIDDFLKNGKSVRMLARRAIDENSARYDVADTLY